MLISTLETTSQEIQLEILTDLKHDDILKHDVAVGKRMSFTVFSKPMSNTIIHSNTQCKDLGVALDSFLHYYYCLG